MHMPCLSLIWVALRATVTQPNVGPPLHPDGSPASLRDRPPAWQPSGFSSVGGTSDGIFDWT